MSVTVISSPDALADLTRREMETLALMTEGLSNRGIAERMVIGEAAVEKHVGNVLWKVAGFPEARSLVNRRVLAVVTYFGSRRP